MGELRKTRRAPQSRASVKAKEKARKLRARAMMRQSQSSRPSWLANSLIQAKEKHPGVGGDATTAAGRIGIHGRIRTSNPEGTVPVHILVYRRGQGERGASVGRSLRDRLRTPRLGETRPQCASRQ